MNMTKSDFGPVLCEIAFLNNIYILSSNVGIAKEIVFNNKNGYIYQNKKDLIKKFEMIINLSIKKLKPEQNNQILSMKKIILKIKNTNLLKFLMSNFYKNKKVLITGHTGFKGSWLSLYLHLLGSKVYGISLNPIEKFNNFHISNIKKILQKNYIFDLRNYRKLEKNVNSISPDVIFHLAAQPLVSISYKNPYLTWTSNLISALNLCDVLKNYKKKLHV